MYFTDRSLLPENQPPLIITAAPYGPVWAPSDFPGQVPVTWDEQVQAAVDCYQAGARILHIHVRDPKTGKISKNFDDYGRQIARLREAVPGMVLQVGGSISFSPEGDEVAHWQSYDTRHMLTELDPKPDQVTVAIGSTSSNGPSRRPGRPGSLSVGPWAGSEGLASRSFSATWGSTLPPLLGVRGNVPARSPARSTNDATSLPADSSTRPT